jgi:hypothetical protein
MARWACAIDAAAPNSFARLEILGLVEVFYEAAGVGRDCRFPFGAAPKQSAASERGTRNDPVEFERAFKGVVRPRSKREAKDKSAPLRGGAKRVDVLVFARAV